MRLNLHLTGRCNLRCDYCLQTDRQVRARMERSTADAALEAVLGAGPPPHSVNLSGGEPFVARGLVRHVVHRVRDRTEEVRCSIITNGTLLNDADVDFLAEQDVHLQVSFDGVPSAQAHRGQGTHDAVLGLLEGGVARRPAWAREHLSVAMTVHTANVSTLALSARRLCEAGLSSIRMGALLTHDPGWTRPVGDAFEEQIEHVVDDSQRLWNETGAVPVEFLQPSRPSAAATERPSWSLCGVSSAHSLTVDPDGRGWACPAFVGSMQSLPGANQETFAALDLGDVRVPEFRRRLAALPRAAGRLPLLRSRELKRSARGACADCPVHRQCAACPASTTHIPGNLDPHRVPDNQCDFQFVTLAARRRFLARTEPSFAPPFFARPPLPAGF